MFQSNDFTMFIDLHLFYWNFYMEKLLIIQKLCVTRGVRLKLHKENIKTYCQSFND